MTQDSGARCVLRPMIFLPILCFKAHIFGWLVGLPIFLFLISFRVVVHSKTSLPLIEEEGVGVQPNTALNLALDRVINHFKLRWP